MMGYYDYRLVVLSVLIAMLGAYCTIELVGRVTAAHGWTRASWLIGGAPRLVDRRVRELLEYIQFIVSMILLVCVLFLC
jgi:hypothetical protein